ncbi:MAG: ankyrin repeat domain-containing protein [Planctomycetota bacterium]|jgi:pectate lyase
MVIHEAAKTGKEEKWTMSPDFLSAVFRVATSNISRIVATIIVASGLGAGFFAANSAQGQVNPALTPQNNRILAEAVPVFIHDVNTPADVNDPNSLLPKAIADSNAVETRPVISAEDDASRYLNAVIEFADNVLKYGKDTYGSKDTPLFVDGLMVRDPNDPNYGKDGVFKPVEWIAPNGDRWILSNLASQQNLFRVLDALTTITGDPKYRQAAMDAIRYAFDNLRSPNGLLYWGHVAAYDAQGDRVRGSRHTFKLHYPYYELMWRVDPSATKKFIEALWSAHILDWSNLDMDRRPRIGQRLEEPWKRVYKVGPTFFSSKQKGRAFFHTATCLVYAGASLRRFSSQEQPVVWSKRLIHRYVRTRHPNTGISALLYNGSWHQLGEDLNEHFTDPYTTVFPYNPFETRFLYYPENVSVQPWISMFLVGDMLGEQGKEFTQWALEELTAWGKVSYRKADNAFIPMLTDGTSIEGYVCKEDITLSPKGAVVKPYYADLSFFWAYAVAYRVTADRFMWEMARDMALGNSFGDIGRIPGDTLELQTDTICSDVYGLLSFLELYAKTRKPEFLHVAQRIGDNIVSSQLYKGFFVSSSKHIYARFGCFQPLALLRLDATIKSRTKTLPQVWPSSPMFVLPYRHKWQGIDRRNIYGLIESSEPPLSLQEAAGVGKINLVRFLIDGGSEVDGREDGFLKTALHRTAMSGHKNVAEFLLAKGAEVNARDSVVASALHYAADKGHKEIAELLIGSGADVNAKNKSGETPLHYAARNGHKDIAELLVEKGATISDIYEAAYVGDMAKVRVFIQEGVDVSAVDSRGWTPLYVAAQAGHTDVVEVLIAHGANVNIENNQGKTPLHLAAQDGHIDVIELLIANGADVSAGGDWTSLNVAVEAGHTGVVELLIANGANVNVGGALNEAVRHSKEMVEVLITHGANVNAGKWTALHVAVDRGRRDMTELLIAKGADVNAKSDKGRTPLHLAARYSTNLAKLLVSSGADINIKDNDGRTPLSYAIERGHTEVVELLRKHGAREADAAGSTADTPKEADKKRR